MLLACSACQHVAPAPIDARANAERLASRSLTDPAVSAALALHGASADDSWSLDELTLAAWTLRTDLAVARAEVAAARAATVVAAQRPNPRVSTTTEKVIDSGAVEPWVVGAALAFDLELGNKREIREQRAAAEAAGLEWAFGEELWRARAQVRAALLDMTLADLLTALDREEADLTTEFLAWVDARFARGAATTSERLAALQAANASASRRELDEAELATALATLAAAVGVSAQEVAQARPESPPLSELPEIDRAGVDRARELAIVNRLDVRRALADYEVAEQDLRAAVAEQYPDLTLAPGYLVDQGDHKITLALDLPVPLFHGAKASIQRAIANRAVAAAKFDEVQAAALAAIDLGFTRYASSRGALLAAERAERAASDAEATLARRFAAGAADRGELLAGRIAAVGLKRAALDARRVSVDAATALENGIQTPLFPASSLETSAAIGELLVGRAP
jgi:outer membrane protein, heavy metal efflux system